MAGCSLRFPFKATKEGVPSTPHIGAADHGRGHRGAAPERQTPQSGHCQRQLRHLVSCPGWVGWSRSRVVRGQGGFPRLRFALVAWGSWFGGLVVWWSGLPCTLLQEPGCQNYPGGLWFEAESMVLVRKGNPFLLELGLVAFALKNPGYLEPGGLEPVTWCLGDWCFGG